ncbi:acyltransferase [Bacteroides helcogenes]|uniref:Acyltransferase 3 n=1 Tax=Bacteroides helcogenes (strain ATCC 35417 / DSM 20613 / JCM 6297 / CCUG 15421 / P 36-108) TaxID=693979 RepID=E6SUN1_BACT6|nr:acyltransferase [Bacteroides helcogenes]ADV43395.1 acyltransferase 3 [Bacteroides helcogenes P 36-108]MDY5238163.1 acyltransferase [Bacteroides helcogenes]
MFQSSSSVFTDSKPHYQLLDGLRGVAALMVIWYHIFEGFATSPLDQSFNHGYMAVDFFFILSGFVIGYAYDDRWKKMKMTDFFKRRLIRLHPMVIMGAILGLITYCIQGCVQWDGTHIGTSMILLSFLLTLFLIPVLPGAGAEVRGNGEMYPLNGPNWSLFFEYIGNLMYALFIHRMSTKALKILVVLLGIGLATFAITNGSGYGHMGVGWTLADNNLLGGFLRMSFSYAAGLLMSRNFKPIKVRGAFWICTLVLFALFAVPHIGGEEALWMNGLYDTVCILFVFPALVFLAASDSTTDKASSSLSKLLGDISYPLYVVHYPFMYLFYAWLWKDGLSFEAAWPVAAGIFFGNILLAYIVLKMYDEPIRKYLARHCLKKSNLTEK